MSALDVQQPRVLDLDQETDPEVLYAAALELYDNDSPQDCVTVLMAALRAYESLGLHDTSLLANLFLALGNAYHAQGNVKAALEMNASCIETLEEEGGPEDPRLLTVYLNTGSIHLAAGQLEEAMQDFLRSRALGEHLVGHDRLIMADVLHNVAVVNDRLGNTGEALRNYETSVRIREKVKGPNDPLLAVTLENMATICRDLGQTDNALALQGRVTEIRKNAFGIRHLDYAKSVYNLGMILQANRDYVKAVKLFSRAASLFNKVVGSTSHPLVEECRRCAQICKKSIKRV